MSVCVLEGGGECQIDSLVSPEVGFYALPRGRLVCGHLVERCWCCCHCYCTPAAAPTTHADTFNIYPPTHLTPSVLPTTTTTTTSYTPTMNTQTYTGPRCPASSPARSEPAGVAERHPAVCHTHLARPVCTAQGLEPGGGSSRAAHSRLQSPDGSNGRQQWQRRRRPGQQHGGAIQRQ